MPRMTPEQEAAYALDWQLPRERLKPAVQAAYDKQLAQRAGQERPAEPGDASASLPGARYGGFLFRPGGARRMPEVQLEFLNQGIRLKRTLFKRVIELYEIRYEDLAEARLAGKWIYRGIRFYASSLPWPLTVVTADYREILDRLERQGVPVNRKPALLLSRLRG